MCITFYDIKTLNNDLPFSKKGKSFFFYLFKKINFQNVQRRVKISFGPAMHKKNNWESNFLNDFFL